MQRFVQFPNHCEPFLDAMCCGQSTAFKAYARQISVDFYYIF